jgi:threonylcarbamoyladenosine tRNA methylthiotransferase MtaB
LACDIIAGFPGETEEEFEKTRELCEKIGFAWIHAFPFSPRPGTEAYSFPEKVREKETSQRVELLNNLAHQGRREYITRWEGKEVEAIIEAGKGMPKGSVPGVSENYLKLCIKCGDERAPAPGSLVKCRILPLIPPVNTRFDAIGELFCL